MNNNTEIANLQFNGFDILNYLYYRDYRDINIFEGKIFEGKIRLK